MENHPKPLSDDERAELEELRAEKARREADAKAERERAELEELRAEKARSSRATRPAPQAGRPLKSAEELEREHDERERQRIEAIRDQHDAELREKGREFMEPDDDLNMPKGQKLVILGVVIVVAILILMSVLGG